MQIVIKIPKEFEGQFNQDRFDDSLERIRLDIHDLYDCDDVYMVSGNYEVEVMDMLLKVFKESTPLPKNHGRLIDADDVKENHRRWLGYLDTDMIERLNIAIDNHVPTIIEGSEADD